MAATVNPEFQAILSEVLVTCWKIGCETEGETECETEGEAEHAGWGETWGETWGEKSDLTASIDAEGKGEANAPDESETSETNELASCEPLCPFAKSALEVEDAAASWDQGSNCHPVVSC